MGERFHDRHRAQDCTDTLNRAILCQFAQHRAGAPRVVDAIVGRIGNGAQR